MFNQDETNIQYILNIGQNYVAAPFLTTTSYAVGDYCSRNGKVYRCNTATSGAWVSARWTEVVIADELSATRVTSGSYVDLVGYTQNNQYVAPCDGYVFVYNTSDLAGFVAIDGHISVGSGKGRFSVYVRKGMSMYEDGSVSYARFVPLQ